MPRDRVPIDDVLRSTLAGFTQSSPTSGRCRVGPCDADWHLIAERAGFWLQVMGGAPAAGPPSLAELRASQQWPWPLKAIRSRPAAPARWCAEWRLEGSPAEEARLRHGVGRLATWFSRKNASGHELSIDGAGGADGPTDWVRRLKELSGREFVTTEHGCRLALTDSIRLDVRLAGGVCHLRRTLFRPAGPVSAAAEHCVLDMLAVANSRLHGCRARVSGETAIEAVEVESRTEWNELSGVVLAAIIRVLDAPATRLARACQSLCDAPELQQAYVESVLGAATV